MDLGGIIGETLWLAGVAGVAFGSGWAWRDRTSKAEIAAKNAEIWSKNAEIAAHGAALHAGHERGRVLEAKLSVLEEHRPLALIREVTELRQYTDDVTKEKQASEKRIADLEKASAELGPMMRDLGLLLAKESRRLGLLDGLLEGLAAMRLFGLKTNAMISEAGVLEQIESELQPYIDRLEYQAGFVGRGEEAPALLATEELDKLTQKGRRES